MRGRRGERAPIRSAEGVMTAPRAPRGDARADLGALLNVAHCVAQLFLAAPRDQHAGVRRREVVLVGRAAPRHFGLCVPVFKCAFLRHLHASNLIKRDVEAQRAAPEPGRGRRGLHGEHGEHGRPEGPVEHRLRQEDPRA